MIFESSINYVPHEGLAINVHTRSNYKAQGGGGDGTNFLAETRTVKKGFIGNKKLVKTM